MTIEKKQQKENHNAKLTQLQADLIREEYAGGEVSQRELAKRYGVSQNAINQVIAGKTWRGEARP